MSRPGPRQGECEKGSAAQGKRKVEEEGGWACVLSVIGEVRSTFLIRFIRVEQL